MQLEEEQRRKNEESLELLLNENDAQMAKMLAKQKEEEEARVVKRKRKADQIDATNKQPSAPECPVCFLETLLLEMSSFFLKTILVLNVSCTGLL